MRFPIQPPKPTQHSKIKRISPDKGPAERWQHATQQVMLVEEAQSLVAHALENSILDLLFLHKLITRLEREAALRFFADYMSAGLAPHCVASYSAMPRSGIYCERDRSEQEERAYQKWRDAMRTMGGAVNGVVESTICHEQMPAEEKVAFLRVGLKKLIKFYGVSGVDDLSDDKVNQASAGQVAVGRGVGTQSVC